MQDAGRAPQQGEDEVAEADADPVREQPGDRLHQAVGNLERGDDEGILLGREPKLGSQLRRQDAQGVAVDVVDHGAQGDQHQDVPAQPTDCLHDSPPSHGLAGRRSSRREVDAGEAAALVCAAGTIHQVGLRQDLGREILGVLLRAVAQPLAACRRPVAARVGRHAPGDQEADLRRVDAAQGEIQQVVQPEPGAEVAHLGWTRDRAADAHADALDAVLVPVKPGQALAPHLAQAVEAVRAEVAVQLEALVHAVHAGGVVGAGEDDAPDPMPPCALIDGVQADEVVLDHLRQRPFDAGACQVDQDIDAGEQAVHVRRVAQVAMGEVLAGTERLQRLGPACGAEVEAASEQGRAQEPAELAPGAGQGDLRHAGALRMVELSPVLWVSHCLSPPNRCARLAILGGLSRLCAGPFPDDRPESNLSCERSTRQVV